MGEIKLAASATSRKMRMAPIMAGFAKRYEVCFCRGTTARQGFDMMHFVVNTELRFLRCLTRHTAIHVADLDGLTNLVPRCSSILVRIGVTDNTRDPTLISSEERFHAYSRIVGRVPGLTITTLLLHPNLAFIFHPSVLTSHPKFTLLTHTAATSVGL